MRKIVFTILFSAIIMAMFGLAGCNNEDNVDTSQQDIDSYIDVSKISNIKDWHFVGNDPLGNESLEIPDALVFDPMSVEGKLPEGLLKTDNNNVKQAFEYLVRKIYCASSPYPFSFGPMADLVTETAGRTYSLNESISTMYISGTVSSVSDDFESYKRLTELDETAQARGQTYYTLKCGIEANGKSASSYTWHICEDGSAAGEYELSSDPIRYDPEEGIPALKLIAEAESIRELAANIGWITEPFSEGFSKIYTFVKNNR